MTELSPYRMCPANFQKLVKKVEALTHVKIFKPISKEELADPHLLKIQYRGVIIAFPDDKLELFGPILELLDSTMQSPLSTTTGEPK